MGIEKEINSLRSIARKKTVPLQRLKGPVLFLRTGEPKRTKFGWTAHLGPSFTADIHFALKIWGTEETGAVTHVLMLSGDEYYDRLIKCCDNNNSCHTWYIDFPDPVMILIEKDSALEFSGQYG